MLATQAVFNKLCPVKLLHRIETLYTCDCNSSVDVTGTNGNTALMFAARQGHLEMARHVAVTRVPWAAVRHLCPWLAM